MLRPQKNLEAKQLDIFLAWESVNCSQMNVEGAGESFLIIEGMEEIVHHH